MLVGKIERRVYAGEGSDGDRKQDQVKEVDGKEGDRPREIDACCAVIGPKDQLDEAAGNDHGQQAEKDRFADDLQNKRGARGAEGLFEPYLFAADRRTGSNEIDVVDDGKENEQPGDGPQKMHLRQIAVLADIEFHIIVEIDGSEGLDEKGDGAGGVFPFFIADRRARGRVNDLFAEAVEPGLQIRLRGAGFQFDIIVEGAGDPVGGGPGCIGASGEQQLGTKMRFFEALVENGDHRIRFQFFTDVDRFSDRVLVAEIALGIIGREDRFAGSKATGRNAAGIGGIGKNLEKGRVDIVAIVVFEGATLSGRSDVYVIVVFDCGGVFCVFTGSPDRTAHHVLTEGEWAHVKEVRTNAVNAIRVAEMTIRAQLAVR